MLTTCEACAKEISIDAQSCPNCGHPQKKVPNSQLSSNVGNRKAPVFFSIALISFILSLTTPRLLLVFPLMATLGSSVIALIRKEKFRGGSITILVLGVGVWFLSSAEIGSSNLSGSRSTATANLASAEVVDFNWSADPNFGTRGVIKWNVQVKNKSNRNMSSVKVDLTTFDKDGKMVSTTSTYIRAIPAGQTRSDSSFADLYRTEKRASVVVSDVRFAD